MTKVPIRSPQFAFEWRGLAIPSSRDEAPLIPPSPNHYLTSTFVYRSVIVDKFVNPQLNKKKSQTHTHTIRKQRTTPPPTPT
jgi:hypothetical protein